MAEASRWSAELVGGHPALDLVNSVSWRLDEARTIDRLPDDDALVRWAAAVGLGRIAGEWVDGSAAVRAVRELRESAYEVLAPLAVGGEPDPAAVRRLRELVVAALAVADVAEVVPLRWTIRPSDVAVPASAGGMAPVDRDRLAGLRLPAVLTLNDLPALLALVVWRLLEDERLDRLKQCQDGGCGWLFLDRTKNASRRWCSSADCGNRSRARRHYQRRRDPALPPAEAQRS
jgi:predicted RNA-binding Zn ribbon-like protein